MKDSPSRTFCILNGGSGAWAFQELATTLARALNVPISQTPGVFNYVLQCVEPITFRSFIPYAAVHIAADKRLVAQSFAQADVPTPETYLFETFSALTQYVSAHSSTEWCLKFPTGCGANGHRFVSGGDAKPSRWPRPWVLQEFVRLPRPEVYRTYAAGGSAFGWVARRFPEGAVGSPWVSHARGARYEIGNEAPSEALHVAQVALEATGLWESFGCVDLIRRPSGEWLALEVGTDGIFNHVDRDLDNAEFEMELSDRIAAAFWKRARVGTKS